MERNLEYERCVAEGDVYFRADARERELKLISSLSDEQIAELDRLEEERYERYFESCRQQGYAIHEIGCR